MYLFLDIDGVLRSLDSTPWSIDRVCLNNFENVIRRFSNLNIVISSSWRLDYSLEALRGLFSPDVALKVIGVTPEAVRLTQHYRYNEVMQYLQDNKKLHLPWIAVDDDSEHYPDSCELVITDSYVGFDNEAANKLSILFNKFMIENTTG